jgi:isobutyryl-CoA mutase
MTINGPAPTILAMFFNTAIDQQVEVRGRATAAADRGRGREDPRAWALQTVRGTVQADILKEDQGQNTCIFSTEFALKMMGDIQEYFVHHKVRNFYSVSISGYHIAEAGREPDQPARLHAGQRLHLRRGLPRARHAHRRLRAQPVVLLLQRHGPGVHGASAGWPGASGRWRCASKYGANERSQKLKYHIQTSGRSLHAQEMDFNDIRTTLQALIATYDNCNSLHTNAYDEAITTPDRGVRAPGDGDPAHHQQGVGPGEEREPQPGQRSSSRS